MQARLTRHIKPLIINQAGFTLVELLVSLFILSISLLGSIALQANSLRLSFSTYQQTQLQFLTQDLIERARSNPTVSYQISFTADHFDASSLSKNCYLNNCTPRELRAFDLHYWKLNSIAALPDLKSASVTFISPNSLNSRYSIKLILHNRQTTNASQSSDTIFETYFTTRL